MIDRRRTAEEAVADMFGVDVNHLRQAPKFWNSLWVYRDRE